MRLTPLLNGLKKNTSIPYMWEARSDGLHVYPRPEQRNGPQSLLTRALTSSELRGLLEQLAGDELASTDDDTRYVITWPNIHSLLNSRLYSASLDHLQLPPEMDLRPKVRSRKSLTDSDFAIEVHGWANSHATPIVLDALVGGMAQANGKAGLLSPSVWRLLDAIGGFSARPNDQRSDANNRRAWGTIRNLALEAEASLDQFLVRSVVVTPEMLDMEFRRATVLGETVVEISPTFRGAPNNWLDYFDREHGVPEHFNIPTSLGVVHVAFNEAVRTVLREIKKLPDRRAVGARAEAFLINPVAALGSDAEEVIDIDQFQDAKIRAGVLFERFRPAIERDVFGYPRQIGLEIDATDGSSSLWFFENDEEAKNFAADLRKRLRNGLQILAWKEHEFELDGDATQHLTDIEAALDERRKPPIEVRHDQIFDLSSYSERVWGIGKKEDFISVYIVKKTDDEGWFSSTFLPVLSSDSDDKGNDIGVPLSPEEIPRLKQRIEEAINRGDSKVPVPGFAEPLPIFEVEKALDKIERALARAPLDDALVSSKEPSVDPKDRPTLLIRGNIQSADHIENRLEFLSNRSADPVLPRSFKADVKLHDHQNEGIARLQTLFAASPTYCRGVLLADDMGLGKTIQVLTFIAAEFERDPALAPVIIVAPVSLLENWKQEIDAFFQPGTFRVLTAYGDDLFKLRIPRECIDEELRKEGLVRFLKDGWRNDAQIILTTYETLRDLEFSFAREPWSILVCDEAQKIKNPNAMVTRAAKKLNVRFRVACTGTPVENSLVDVWCLFDLIQPGMLGSLNDFGRRYGRPIESNRDTSSSKIEELRRIIDAQVIRRTKKDVAKDLKEKIFRVPHIQMSTEQRSLYLGALGRLKKDNDDEFGLHHFSVLHYLRLVCADPREYETESFTAENPSLYRRKAPKMDWLLTTLHSIRTSNEKALVFAENREIQRLLQYYIYSEFGLRPPIVNGDTAVSAKTEQSRQKIIKSFQDCSGFGVLILSPVAVGYGVNIQAANHVIHYLRHWNPAKEDQATDRAYRIGQKKDVFVYCPLTVSSEFKTFDVKLDELLARKRAIATDMLRPAGEVKMSEMDLSDIAPDSIELPTDQPVTFDKVERMNGRAFEGLIAALWHKQGYETFLTPPSSDAGVDVIAIRGTEGALIQCKSSTSDTPLGWQAVRDVNGGYRIYADQFPMVNFVRIGLTNKRFNSSAKDRAAKTGVVLLEQPDLWKLLERYPLGMREVALKLASRPWH